jgi:hypothetical protein
MAFAILVMVVSPAREWWFAHLSAIELYDRSSDVDFIKPHHYQGISAEAKPVIKDRSNDFA